MIVDTLNNSKQYSNAHGGFSAGFDFIKKAVSENLPEGRYDIDGENVFAFIQEYTSKEDSSFEAHKNYIDIQFIVSGTEVIEGFDIEKATPKSEYNDVKDVMFYEDNTDVTKSILNAGEYGIFFPNDVHKPGMCLNGEQDTVKKIVVKVKA